MSVEITFQIEAWRKLCSHWNTSPHDLARGLRAACDALEASQARIAAYECIQQSTQTRVRELEDDNSALKLSLPSGGGRLSSGAKIWLQQKERAERAEARVAVLREALREIAESFHWGEDTAIKRTISGIQRDAAEAISTLGPAAERLLEERKLLRKLSESFASVVTEDSVRETLLCYVMGAEALATLTALRDFDEGKK